MMLGAREMSLLRVRDQTAEISVGYANVVK